MSYRYITVSAKIESLDVILKREYAEGVERESRIAEAAPALLAALEECVHKFDWDPSSLTLSQSNALRSARALIASTKGEKP